MSWAVINADGRAVATYGRRQSAELNANGRRVVEAPPAGEARDWRWTDEDAWVSDPVPDQNAARLAAMSRDERRRTAYARRDRDKMLEVAVEIVLALAEDPTVAERLRPTTRAKVEELNREIAAVKAEHP